MEVYIKGEEKFKICSKLKIAETFLDRTIGLMFKSEMVGFDGLLIQPCNSVHTFFCKFPLDLLFLDKDNKIVELKRGVKPWRMTWVYWKAKKVLELDEGSIPEWVKTGMNIEVKCTS